MGFTVYSLFKNQIVALYLIRNSIAGLLMPFTVSPKGEAFGYYKLILERPLEES
jgi:hypothetical protein